MGVFTLRARLLSTVFMAAICMLDISDLFANAVGPQTSEFDDRPFSLQTASTVDTNLFVLYVLWSRYQSIPAADANSQDRIAWISNTKTEAQTMRAIIGEFKLDSSLESLYQDCLSFTAAYENYLSKVGAIHGQRQSYEGGDVLSSIGGGAHRASDAKDVASVLGANQDNASTMGNFAGLIEGLREYGERSQQRDAAEQAAINAEFQRLNDAYNQTRINARIIVTRMASTHGWQDSETGFDGSAASLSDSSARMPQNPFAAANWAVALKEQENAADLTNRATACFHAAQSVPADAVFDSYRNTFLYDAAALAVQAGSVEVGKRGYSGAPASSAPYAVHLVNTYLSHTKDPGGYGNLLLGRAFAMEGRYSEGLTAENRAFTIDTSNQEDMSTVLRYSDLLSMTGSVDSSAQWLQKAYSLGFSDIASIRDTEDYGNLRRQRPKLFSELTTAVLTNPEFVWGVILDDSIVRNRSPFDLTNVVIQVNVHKQGRNYPFTMKCARIKAGEACRVNNVVSIPGDSFDDLQASFSSDQTQ
jgi:hypothetical protein